MTRNAIFMMSWSAATCATHTLPVGKEIKHSRTPHTPPEKVSFTTLVYAADVRVARQLIVSAIYVQDHARILLSTQLDSIGIFFYLGHRRLCGARWMHGSWKVIHNDG